MKEIEKVPCIRAEDLTDDQIKAFRIVDNKTSELSGWDIEKLDIEIGNVELDLSEWFGHGWDPSAFDYEDPEEPEEQEEIGELEDVERIEKYYGVPYQGNKSRIADRIINFLPEGKRFVDLFGGGGAMSHCALLSGKWETVLYNDINPLITNLFMDAVNGKIKPRIVTREDFEKEKCSDGYVKYIWSFGNKGESYLWGRDVEEIKLKACYMLMADTWQERRKLYRKLIIMLKREGIGHAENLQGLQGLERLQALKGISGLQVSNIDYRDYKHESGDIVYCDIPYNTGAEHYGIDFDHDAFYEWVRSRDYQVYFSEYGAPDDFYRVKVHTIQQRIGADTNRTYTTEYLFSNMEM